MKKKALIGVSALVLILTIAIGGTVAWLIDSTDTVTNTFTYGDVTIELTETTGTNYKMIPGNTIAKDPTVTVKGGSEDCWLFVEIVKSGNFDDFMTYNPDSQWTTLASGVYYRQVTASEGDQNFQVLANNEVTVLESVTKSDFNALTTATYPTLAFTAYAVQADNVDSAAEAWTLIRAKTIAE